MTTPTRSESLEAIRNDWKDVIRAFDPNIVTIEREEAPEGAMLLAKVTVHAPSYVIVDGEGNTPKRVEQQSFHLLVYNGYPAVKPKVYFGPYSRNASVNCFSNKVQCTDAWNEYSSMLTLIEKTVLDIIHHPSVTRYNSMACSALEHWQKEMTANGTLPTIPPERIYRKKNPVLPSRPAGSTFAGSTPAVKRIRKSAPPSLPSR